MTGSGLRAPETTRVIVLKGISKSFPGVLANDAVDLDIRRGEIHALLGENGAGKSTLMNILTGIYQPDAGEIFIDDKSRSFGSPNDAIAAGIGMVHQHFRLVPAFTVAENVHLGWIETPRLAAARVLERRTAALAHQFKLELRPSALVSDLSVGEQQRVEILRILARGARVLILDEPTAVLTPPEVEDLFSALRDYREAGNSIIFISHKLDEVLELSDRVSILRSGRKVLTENTQSCDAAMLARRMVGRDLPERNYRARSPSAAAKRDEPILSVRNVSLRDERGLPVLSNISFDARAGEILGVAGVAGNGQRQLAEILTGMTRPTSGEVLIAGKQAPLGAARFVDEGVGHIPEDRTQHGLAPTLSIIDNAIIREYRRPPISSGPVLDRGAAAAAATTITNAGNIQASDLRMPAANLSGGNQQRLVVRREMRVARNILVAAYPSRGLDVGAIEMMHRDIVELRDNGAAVIFISEELDEILDLADWIVVLSNGKLTGKLSAEDADLETIGLMMGGRVNQRESSAP